MALGIPLLGIAEPAAAANAQLDRPTFDRTQGAILVPYKGPVPASRIDRTRSGTRLVVEFSGSVTQLPTAYKLGLFHPLVSKVEMASLGGGKVRLTIDATQPSRLSVVPDPSRGVLRLVVSEDAPAVAEAAPPAARPAERPGLDRVAAPPPQSRPQPMPSLPPTARRQPPAGTPTSGEYVYRKVVPGSRGDDVTEVAVRTRQQAAIQVTNDPRTQAVVVNVVRPGQVDSLPADAYSRQPLPNEPWWLPDRRHEAAYRPVTAIDSLVGYTLMGERAPDFGSELSGQGAALWGFAGHLPLSRTLNLSLGGESFGYTVQSQQLPDARTQRNEYFLYTRGEYLAIRRPWV
ncbi:MAG: AMIN domain-containing protein, partial [Candidatus Sericytochromatia bacterium]